jgi:thiol:disulfide interchange protein DsbD
MRKWLASLAVLALGWSAMSAGAQARTQVQLLLSHDSARAGETMMAGVQFTMRPRWHIYWRNPGESGIPTGIEWTLPKGVTAGDIQWPVPEKALFTGLTTYEYRGTAMLLVPLKLAADLPAGSLELSAKVSWLECEEEGQCVPGRTTVDGKLTVSSEAKPSADASEFESAKKKLPATGVTLNVLAGWEKAGDTNGRPLIVEWDAKDKLASVDFYPYESSAFEVAASTDSLSTGGGKARLRKLVKLTEGKWPTEIRGLLLQKGTGDEHASTFEVSLSVPLDAEPATKPATPAGSASGSTVAESPPLLKMLWFGFIGGLILNIMPCVFPVIALKILGFVQQSKESPQRVLKLGLIYAAGVVASFLVMAALVIAVKSAGKSASWGMQMQNPQFSVFLTTLVTLVALNLFGLFEVNLSGTAMGAASELAYKEGSAGAFFNGVFATVLATPCTAPFLAPALGFAFAQPAGIILAMFMAVALGLAFPYVVLSWQPAWVKFLPRPGAWMEKFKVAMGFPMLATAVWLFSFTAKRFGEDGPLWLGLFLVIVALAAWVWGQFVQRGGQRRGLAIAISLLMLLGGYAYALEGELHWRSPVKKTQSNGAIQSSSDGLVWQKWSTEAVAKARAEGRPVLVDFTADWCLTCKANKRTSIEIPSVRAKLKEINAVTFIGDNTDEDPLIATELKRFDRAGVPLVLVYPKDASKPPEVLPAFLTPGIMLDALARAAK